MILIITSSLPILSINCASPCPDIGKSAPDFTLESIEGGKISLSDFQGKKILLNFWATWCGPCKSELPFFQAIHSEQSMKNVAIVAIDIKENTTTVKNFADSQDYTFTILLDKDAKIAQKYCLPSALPITIFIDSQGIIKARKIGAFRSQDELEKMLRSL